MPSLSPAARESAVRVMSLEMASHHRLDPMTSRDRCTCGHKTKLGEMFHTHVAQSVAAALWGIA